MYNQSNPVIQSCRNIDKAKINNIEYNLIVDLPVGVHLYDSNWKYQSTFSMPDIYYGIVANNNYYFSGGTSGGIIKTSLTSSAIIKSYGTAGVYRGLYYDSIGSRIIAAGCDVHRVDILDLDLNLLSSVSMPGMCPHGVTVHNSKVYVTRFYIGYVAIISNGMIENTFTTVCFGRLASISVDSVGYFALSCAGDGKVYLYDSNMQYTSK